MASRPGFFRRLADKATPSREEVLESRWLKPFGKSIRRSDLWRFTRRSVPRGVAGGLFVGIFLMIPGLQIVGAALLSMIISFFVLRPFREDAVRSIEERQTERLERKEQSREERASQRDDSDETVEDDYR